MTQVSKKIRLLASLLLLATITLGCPANHVQPPVTPATALEGLEVSYALPRTVIAVRAPVTLEKTSRGGCADHLNMKMTCDGKGSTIAECIAIDPDINEASKHTLGTASLSTTAEPDPSQIYQVKLTGSALQKRRVLLEMSESGLLTQGESESKSKTLSFATGIIKSLAGLAAVFASAEDEGEKKCLAAADQILEVREQVGRLQDAILAGKSVPADSVELVLDRLDAKEKKLLGKFSRSQQTTAEVTCRIVPQHSDVAAYDQDGALTTKSFSVPLFEVRQLSGVCAAGDSGCATGGDSSAVRCFIPEILRTKTSSLVPGERVQSVRLDLSYPENQYAEALRKAGIEVAGSGSERSFHYRVPAVAGFSLIVATSKDENSSEQTVLREERLIAQFGPVGSLPGKNADLFTVALYENSGALKKVTSLREPVDTTDTTGILDAVTTVVKADKASDDELALLERERKILEERKKIEDLLKELDESPAEPD